MGGKVEFEAKALHYGDRHYVLLRSDEKVEPCIADGCWTTGAYRVTLEPIEPELKPCPFCGGKAEVSTTPEGSYYWVACRICESRGAVGDWAGAREAWNRRQ